MKTIREEPTMEHEKVEMEYDASGGPITQVIEEQRLFPTDTFLWAAGASIMGSLILRLTGRVHTSLFVGQWAPTFLLLAVYQKLTKATKHHHHHHHSHGEGIFPHGGEQEDY